MIRGASTGKRLVVSVAVGLVVGVLTGLLGSLRLAPAVGWDVAAAVLLAWVWFTIWPMGSAETSRHATREDPTRPVSDVVLLGAAVVSLAAVGLVVIGAGTARGAQADVLAGIGVLTVALSWGTVHTVFTLRYALLYYGAHDGGIDFNQSMPPRYSDFAYLAFTLGMTFQVSDTDLKTPEIRATSLRHALLSYLFGAVIVATVINLVAGMGGS
jgi:uncharacterized membrane protein